MFKEISTFAICAFLLQSTGYAADSEKGAPDTTLTSLSFKQDIVPNQEQDVKEKRVTFEAHKTNVLETNPLQPRNESTVWQSFKAFLFELIGCMKDTRQIIHHEMDDIKNAVDTLKKDLTPTKQS